MYLPYDSHIDARVLAAIYKNTTATYKFYWFASILDLMAKEAKVKMTFWEVIIGMVAQAWYPIHYFRISFGLSDSLSNRIMRLQQELGIPIDVDPERLKSTLQNNLNNPKVKACLPYSRPMCRTGSSRPGFLTLLMNKWKPSPAPTRTIVCMPLRSMR